MQEMQRKKKRKEGRKCKNAETQRCKRCKEGEGCMNANNARTAKM